MKIVGLIPASLSLDKSYKNVKELGGLPLVNYTLRTMNKVPRVDKTVVFASEPGIRDYIRKELRYEFLERPAFLDQPQIKAQDIIEEYLKVDRESEIIVAWHITSPFLKAETITDCIDKVSSGEYTSAFTAFEIRKFCWFQGKPLNYSLDKPTPRTQDIEPLIVEQSALYVFRREVFEETRQRISDRPYIKIIDHFEGHDIDTIEDFDMAELIVDTGFFELS